MTKLAFGLFIVAAHMFPSAGLCAGPEPVLLSDNRSPRLDLDRPNETGMPDAPARAKDNPGNDELFLEPSDDPGETDRLFEENDNELDVDGRIEPPTELQQPHGEPRGWGIELGGSIGAEFRYFPQKGQYRGQDYHDQFSVILQPELSYRWDGGNQSIVFVPFFIGDSRDSSRTHFDIRELWWSKAMGDWGLRVGIGKVFWGVLESAHIVDIVNQTDLVVNIDGEEKLGQPMIELAYTTDYGTFEGFVLPFFRRRTFPGEHGRLRPRLVISQYDPIYDSSLGSNHVDFAVRWAHTMGDWDIGFAHFYGTSREPRFFLSDFVAPGIPTRLRPVYEIINQTSVDIQAVKGSWLWKLEAFTRSGQGAFFGAVGTGFEYTFSGVFESGADLGLLAEYLYDGRGKSNLNTLFDNDIFVGMRLAFNDAQSTEVLAGITKDLEASTWVYGVEASRRLGNNWKLNLEVRGLVDAAPEDLLPHEIRKDTHIIFQVVRFL